MPLSSVDHIDGVLPVNQERSRNARDRLLQAGDRVFARMGYDAAHVTDIAAAADCSVGSFYRRFRDKEAFFRALHHQFTVRYQENIERFFTLPEWDDEPTTVVVSTLIANTSRVMHRHHGFFRALFQRSLAGAGADYWPAMRAGTELQGQLLARFIAARGEGKSENLEQNCIFALRAIDGAIVHAILNDGPHYDPQFAQQSLARMALAFLGLPTEPLRVVDVDLMAKPRRK
jgi:AcrR family transcriptional regulator